jgi:ubiquinone/menaquinone biosynthesis C-methylase UbiE
LLVQNVTMQLKTFSMFPKYIRYIKAVKHILDRISHLTRNKPMVKGSERKRFLATMFKEAMKPYEHPGEQWNEGEKEFLPIFTNLVTQNSLILDLAGGYGRVSLRLMQNENHVVLTDLSIHSLKYAKKSLRGAVDLVRADMLHLPFVEEIFDGVWFTQAFEYVPPEFRKTFLKDLNRTMKKNSYIFVNVESRGKLSLISYLGNCVNWRVVNRQPIIWGDFIYRLKLPYFDGWHYHSIVFSRKIEKTFKQTNFKILKFGNYHDGYLTYLLQAQ